MCTRQEGVIQNKHTHQYLRLSQNGVGRDYLLPFASFDVDFLKKKRIPRKQHKIIKKHKQHIRIQIMFEV